MCQFGKSDKIIREYDLNLSEAKIGIREWYINNSLNDKKKELKSLNREYIWPLIAEGNPEKENSEGIYSYYNYNNYNNNYNYYNYNNNNNNYNNYNYYYNYYNYSYNNNNNNNNNYNLLGTILLWGKIYEYKEGFRSQFAKVESIAIIDNPLWLESKDKKEQEFLIHFHKACNEVAENYQIKTIGYSELEKL